MSLLVSSATVMGISDVPYYSHPSRSYHFGVASVWYIHICSLKAVLKHMVEPSMACCGEVVLSSLGAHLQGHVQGLLDLADTASSCSLCEHLSVHRQKGMGV